VSSNVVGGGGGGGGSGGDIMDTERIIVSNYGDEEGGGILSVFGFGNDGAISPHPVVVAFGPGSNVNPHRQGMSHAHSTSVVAKQSSSLSSSSSSSSSSSLILCCADLGSDAIVQFSMSAEKSKDAEDGGISLVLSCNETGRMSAPPGSGPRSIMFNPIFGDVAIVSLEMTAQVWLVRRDAETGGLAAPPPGEPASLLPDDDNWPGESDGERQFNGGRWASDAVWSPCGKFAYAAARLHNSISVFRFSTTVVGGGGGGGASSSPSMSSSSSSSVGFKPLTFVQRVSTRGITPRCLCMSDCGKFILVAHQHSHDVSSFRRNETDGSIAFVHRLDAPNAACVKLIRPDDIGF
jgi:6-phosphogluconolactonase (cycloisomerase 2 family)